MKDFFSPFLSNKSWLIQEDSWNRHDHSAREAQFSQGNGDLGVRGILEEIPLESVPGTFLAGLYDKTSAQQTELVNLPNPLHFKITVNGEKLGMGAMTTLRHKRTLDMRHGILTRRTLFQNSRKQKFDYQSIRFVSQDNEKVIAFRIYLTALDHSAEITVRNDIDAGIHNHGVLTEGRKRHFQIAQVFQSDQYDYLSIKTLEKGVFVAYASSLSYQIGKKKVVTGDPAFILKMKKGQTIKFTKIIVMTSSPEPHSGTLERITKEALESCMVTGFDSLLNRHSKSFRSLWNVADIGIKGEASVQRALRFNIYHMLICGPRKAGLASIGAKTLSGEGYRGHIFWDAEIFIVPFFIFTFPDIARNMLLYRYDRLPAAREIAKQQGYRGAKFPWESADTGEETTPDWAKDFDGRIIKVRTGEQEHHIVADIAYILDTYYSGTNDEDFMLRYGYELMFETARFWASRVHFNAKWRTYDIKRVIGPDEFHENINNNAYTNMMAKWNLRMAAKMYGKFRQTHHPAFSSLTNKLNLKPSEVKSWMKIDRGLYFPIRKDGVIEQFKGYFKRKRGRITHTDKHGLPDIPVGLDLSKIGKTQFVKQADVVMLLHLFSNSFSSKLKKKNYDFYISRTLHKSSLSPSIYSIVGNQVGDSERAYQLFLAALNVDLENVRGGLRDGIHAASLGGVWQAVVHGFAGIRMMKERITVDPRLPKAWKNLSLTLIWHGIPLSFSIHSSSVTIKVKSKKSNKIPIRIFGRLNYLSAGRTKTFPR